MLASIAVRFACCVCLASWGLCAQETKPADPPVQNPPAQDSPPTTKEADPGRPVLRRGGAATKHTDSGPAKTEENIPATIRDVSTGSDEPPAVGKDDAVKAPAAAKPDDRPTLAQAPVEREEIHAQRGDDATIAMAREYVYQFTQSLPSFICDEVVKRYESHTFVPKWKYMDRVETELVFDSGKEVFRNIRRNGKPLKQASPEDTGQWSSGDFSAALANVFHPQTRAVFKLRAKESTASGLKTVVYDYKVQRDNSHWTIRVSYPVKPAYSGAVWIEPETGRVLRLEMSTHALPADYAVDKVESTVDYDSVTIGGKKYLMPVRSGSLSCVTGGFDCDKNEIEFRNFRKFEVESQVMAVDSDISFPDQEKGEKKTEGQYEPPQISTPASPK
jgi:hypothetical protein